MRKTYESNKLPIIIVLTQAYGDNEDEDDDDDDDDTDSENNNDKNNKINKSNKNKKKSKKNKLYKSFDNTLYSRCRENLGKRPRDISFIEVIAKPKKMKNSSEIGPIGLDELLFSCIEKAEYACYFACLSAIKVSATKKINDNFLKIKQKIINSKEEFLKKLFEQKGLEEKIFEDIIEKIFMAFSQIENRDNVNQDSFNIIKEMNKKIIDLILEKEEKKFNNYIEDKAKNIACILMDEQILIGKKHDVNFTYQLKDNNEFAFRITYMLKRKFNYASKINAIKNAANLISSTIIDEFRNLFINSYLENLNSNETQTFLKSSITNCFSSEFKEQIKDHINDLKQYQDKYKLNTEKTK